MIWLLPQPPPLLSRMQAVSSLGLPECRQSSLLRGGGGGGKGREPNHTLTNMPGLLSYIKYSLLLSVQVCSLFTYSLNIMLVR
jgi:hypothetical protein